MDSIFAFKGVDNKRYKFLMQIMRVSKLIKKYSSTEPEFPHNNSFTDCEVIISLLLTALSTQYG